LCAPPIELSLDLKLSTSIVAAIAAIATSIAA
jgi:hypothetical protein